MNREEYYRIRDEVYKNAGIDKYDFDLMMLRIVTKAVEEEREMCAQTVASIAGDEQYRWAAMAIRERGAP